MKKVYLLFTSIYLAGVFLITLAIFSYHYYSHRWDLIQNSIENAASLAKNGELSTPNYFGAIYLLYDSEDHLIRQFSPSNSQGIQDFNISSCKKKLADKTYDLRYGTAVFAYDHSTRIVLISSCPFFKNKMRAGTFVMIRDLPNIFLYLVIFFTVFTLIYLTVFLSFRYIDKKKSELEKREKMYLADMNHELKSPITSIRSLMEAILDGYVTDEEKLYQYYEMILTETSRLEAAIQEILELSSLFEKKIQKEAVSAEQVFKEILFRYSTIGEDQGIVFLFPDITQLPSLKTNQKLMSRALDLLLHNTFKFTPEGGSIILSIYTEQKHLTLHLKDNGCGIPPQALPHIFERFYQVDSSHNASGSGLGLSIVKTIMDELQESIQVFSEPNKGTEFIFTISLS